MSKSQQMQRYVVKVRTPAGNETIVRQVEAISRSSIDAMSMVIHALGISDQHFTATVKHVGIE